MVKTTTAKVLVLDDDQFMRKLLTMMLDNLGYTRVIACDSGIKALAWISDRDGLPDLILLDINMPEMNGYEVCTQLKARADTRDIPVIFISAVNSTAEIVKAFQCGGVDYIRKPFQVEEVQARVETHLTIRALHSELERHNQHLEEMVRERTRQLADANDRLAILDKTKSEFLNLISHELRSPLNGVFGVAELLFDEAETDPELRAMYDVSREGLLSIIDDALLLTQIDVSTAASTLQAISLQQVLDAALTAVRTLAEFRGIPLPSCPVGEQQVYGDAALLVRAFTALVETAVKFAAGDNPVCLSMTRTPSHVEIGIRAFGYTIPPEFLPTFFDVFAVTRAIVPGGDIGLGPAVAQRIIALSNGSVTVQNEEPAGISFRVRLVSRNRDTSPDHTQQLFAAQPRRHQRAP